MARSGRKRLHLWVRESDRYRLDLICEVYGVSKTGAVQVALRAACEKLGIEKQLPTLIEKNTTSA